MSDFNEIFGAQGFDPASVPAQNYDPLPAGWYTVMVEKAEVVDTKARDGKRVKVEFLVTDGEHQGRKLFGGINIVNANPKAQEIGLRELADFSRACGLVTVKDTSEFIDKMLLVKVALRADAGREPDNEIKGYKALGAGTAKPAAPVPKTAATQAPAAAPAPVNSAPAAPKPAGKTKFPWEK